MNTDGENDGQIGGGQPQGTGPLALSSGVLEWHLAAT